VVAVGPALRPDGKRPEDINFPMRLVDVPGLTRGNRLPTQIALSYIKPDNAVILVIGKERRYPKEVSCPCRTYVWLLVDRCSIVYTSSMGVLKSTCS